MSLDDWLENSREIVDPEVRAYVGSLVNAVGGISIEEQGKYLLGDDIVGCLKDLRRWIRFYDEKLDRLDVQRVLAESNFLKGDILEILAAWSDSEPLTGFRARIALLCLELMVPLTWSLEIEDQKMTVHHHKHLPFLKLAQVEYKRAVLHHESGKILRQMIRVALPSMSEPKEERVVRSDGIIRLVLYGLRNVAMISQPQHLPVTGDEAEIARSVTIDAFHAQDVFRLLLTIASSMGEEFVIQDVVILEVLFHILKGIDPVSLFMKDDEVTQSKTSELRGLLSKEKAMLASYKKYAPTRHNRFGTMVWLKKDDERISTISGQSAISGPNRGLQYLDKAKKWNKPKQGVRNREDLGSSEFDREVLLNSSARRHLRAFVEEFLDSSFNPLFTHLRRSIERELERVLDQHHMQFFYLISWFLKAECARRDQTKQSAKSKEKQKEGHGTASNSESFSIIAGVMNQETFVLLNRYLQSSADTKAWHSLNAGMKSFTQILLTVQQMEASTDEDDQDIAENIQNRIFYEETTHDRVLGLIRNYKDQGRGYLDAVTELAHVFIRMLESYSKQNADMQIRSKRRAKKIQQKQTNPDVTQVNEDEPSGDEREAAQRVANDRKFDLQRFSARFSTQGCVDTFVSFIKSYQDLAPAQLKRAHRFFYRVAFKVDLCTMLFRVDIVHLLYNMIKGPNPLDKDASHYKEWEELARQVFKKLTRRLKEHPELMIEMLFSKIPSSVFYLENGFEQEKTTSIPRPPAELEVRPEIAAADRISLVTEILISEQKFDAISWIKEQLQNAKSEREAWESVDEARIAALADAESNATGTPIPDADTMKPPTITLATENQSIQKDIRTAKFKLLMKLLGLEQTSSGVWEVPAHVSSANLMLALSKIGTGERGDTLQSYPDAKAADKYLRRKPNAQPEGDDDQPALHSDSEGEESFDEALLFPAGGPTARKPDVPKIKKGRLKRKRDVAELDDSEKARHANERHKRELEKRRKIKSNLFVNDSDDESDEERDAAFFAKENERRKKAGHNIAKAIEASRKEEARQKKLAGDSGGIKRRKTMVSDDSDEDDDMRSDSDMEISQPNEVIDISSDHSTSDSEDSDKQDEDTPISSQPKAPVASDPEGNKENTPLAKNAKDVIMTDAQDEDEDDSPVKRPVRRNLRAGFVIDDSDSD